MKRTRSLSRCPVPRHGRPVGLHGRQFRQREGERPTARRCAEQYKVLEEEVAEHGDRKSGEWTVNYIIEAAEPWFRARRRRPRLPRPEPAETHHIEIIPTETSTGRIIPDVPITLEVVDEPGQVIQNQKLNFYYSTFFRYADNFALPEAGTYTLRATLGARGSIATARRPRARHSPRA